MPPFTVNALSFTSAVISINVVGLLFLPDFEFSMQAQVGAFAYFSEEYEAYAFMPLGIVAGFMTFFMLGYLVKEFSPLVMCTAYLVEPFFS